MTEQPQRLNSQRIEDLLVERMQLRQRIKQLEAELDRLAAQLVARGASE